MKNFEKVKKSVIINKKKYDYDEKFIIYKAEINLIFVHILLKNKKKIKK